MRSVDVVVVGAGPAGSAAAVTAARAGLDVLVTDRASFPRDKICGDGLTAGALRHLEALGLDPSTVPSWTPAQDCWIRDPAGDTTRFELPRGRGTFAAVATRRDLDASLVELARSSGAEIAEGCAITDASEAGDHVDVHTADGTTVRARWAVAADGMWSPMRKHLGVASPGYRGEWHAFRQYVSNVGPEARRGLYVSFEPDLVPGYFWSFPLTGGRANIGYGIQRGGSHRVGDMTGLWNELLDRPHLRELLGADLVTEEHHRAWPIPARVGELEPTTRRTMFVGDAVAACDVMTGEGIAQALVTGIHAADAIVGSGASGDAAAAYRRALDRELVADHRMSSLLVRGLSSPAAATRAVRLAGATPWTRRNFARWLFEDYPRALVATPRRWHRGAVSRPGAFRGAAPL